MATSGLHAPEEWWDDLDESLLACLSRNGAMSPGELARHVGMSESAAISLLCLLASEGKVRICLVERAATGHDPSVASTDEQHEPRDPLPFPARRR